MPRTLVIAADEQLPAGATISVVALTRARGVCIESGCAEFPVYNGRCRLHARWPVGNPRRASGWEISRLKAMLIAERGARCEQRGGGHAGPIELHHVDGDPANNHPGNLELRCRRHNPRGAGLHRGWTAPADSL